MSMQDPIANMLTIIRNGHMAKKTEVKIVPTSNAIKNIAEVLKSEGYISEYEEIDMGGNKKSLRVALKYYKGKPVISKLKRVSSPGLRVYKPVNELPKILGGLGTAIISTSKGVMSDREARKSGHGGEVICFVE